jgi:hypothetical protein
MRMTVINMIHATTRFIRRFLGVQLPAGVAGPRIH